MGAKSMLKKELIGVQENPAEVFKARRQVAACLAMLQRSFHFRIRWLPAQCRQIQLPNHLLGRATSRMRFTKAIVGIAKLFINERPIKELDGHSEV